MLWGTDALLRVPLLRHLSTDRLLQAVQLVFIEHLILVAVFVPVLWRGRDQLRRLRLSQWLAVAGIGVGASALATVLFTISFGYGHFTETLLLQKTQPLIAIGMARLVLHERMAPGAWLWAFVAVAGAYLIVFPDPVQPVSAWAGLDLVAGLFAMGAAAMWAAGTVLGRYALEGTSVSNLAGLRFVFGLPALAVVLLLVGQAGALSDVRPDDAPLYVALALLPGGIAMLLYYRGLAGTSASVATLAELSFPVTGILVNYYFLTPRQVITGTQIVGVILLWGALAAIEIWHRPLFLLQPPASERV